MEQVVIILVLGLIPFLNAGTAASGYVLLMLAPAILGVIWLHKIIRKEDYVLPMLFKPIFVVHLTFILLMTLATINSFSLSESMTEYRLQVAIFSLVWLGLPFFRQRNFLRHMEIVLCVVGSVLSVISLALLLWPINYVVNGDINFFYPVYGHNRLAEFLLLTIPASGYLLISEKNKRIFTMALIVQLTGLLFTFSRAAILMIGVAPFILFFLSPKGNRPRFTAMMKVAAAVLVSIFILVPFWLNADKNIARGPMISFNKLVAKPLYVNERLNYYAHALKQIAKKPILGYGPATYQYTPENYLARPLDVTNYVHNFFLQITYENGVPASLVYLILIICLVLLAIRGKNFHKMGGPYILTGILISLIHAQLDFDWQIPAIYLTAMVLLFSISSQEQKGAKPSKLIFFFIALSWIPIIFGIVKVGTSDDGSGDGQIRVTRSIQNSLAGNYQKAAEELILSRNSLFRNNLSKESDINQLLKQYLKGNINDGTAAKLIEMLYRGFYPHDFYWLVDGDTAFKSVDKLIDSNGFPAISDKLKSMIYYLKYTENLATDSRQFSEYQKYLERAAEASYLAANLALIDRDDDEIKKAIIKLSKSKETNTRNYLLAYLVEASANDDVGLLQKALDLSPGYGSMFVNLASKLRRLGREEEASKIIEKCSQIHPDCYFWYQESLSQ